MVRRQALPSSHPMLSRLMGALLMPLALLFLRTSRPSLLDLTDLHVELTWEEITEELCR